MDGAIVERTIQTNRSQDSEPEVFGIKDCWKVHINRT